MPAGAILLALGVTLVSTVIIAFFTPASALGRVPDSSHYKVGLLQSASNLRDQASSAHRPKPGQHARLQSLYIYPIKSCQGIELTRSRVLPHGLEFDRLFTFAQRRDHHGQGGPENQSSTWEFLTQRQLPLLASVKVDLWLPNPAKKASATKGKLRGVLNVRFPWTESGLPGLVQWIKTTFIRGPMARPEMNFLLPLEFPSGEDILARGYVYEEVRIWKDTTSALNLAADVPPELKRYLGLSNSLGLFRMDPSRQRQVFRCAPRKEDAGYQPVVDFHDAYPLHLMSLSSLQDLDSKIEKDDTLASLDVRRFRSNIIVSGANAYDEETWRTVGFQHGHGRGAESLFDVSCRTVRCKMPNVDPEMGIRHRVEPDRSLRKHRDVDQGAPKYGCLGMQLCPLFADAGHEVGRESMLEVGMKLRVLQTGSHLYIKQ